MDRTHINDIVKEATNMTVLSGPFTGLKLLDIYCWGDGDISSKLLGVYEQELHESIERLRQNKYGVIFDIGCAEGFYAIGLAITFPDNKILAFDANTNATDIAHQTAFLNNVAERIVFGQHCDSQRLVDEINKVGRSLIFADCEGYEKNLLCNTTAQRVLRTSDLIIECHDYFDKSITSSIFEYYFESHNIKIIEAGGRNPNVFPFLSKLTDPERWQAVNENRMCKMHWLVLEARSRR